MHGPGLVSRPSRQRQCRVSPRTRAHGDAGRWQPGATHVSLIAAT